MALPATHIRFAATLSKALGVTDMAAYLSGTIYPDSRWVTGVAREQTHDRRCLDSDFGSDDFTRGWHVHCRCDRIQGDIHHLLLDGLSVLTADERWIRMAAAKLVQDMNDAVQGDVAACLDLLCDARTPNGEPAADVAAYLDAVRRAYGRRAKPDWSDYAGLWRDVGLDQERISRIEQYAAHILTDASLVADIRAAFDRMVKRWNHSPPAVARS
jgi:hypothetical protein